MGKTHKERHEPRGLVRVDFISIQDHFGVEIAEQHVPLLQDRCGLRWSAAILVSRESQPCRSSLAPASTHAQGGTHERDEGGRRLAEQENASVREDVPAHAVFTAHGTRGQRGAVARRGGSGSALELT